MKTKASTKIKGLADTHAEEERRMTRVEIDILADDGRRSVCRSY
jgi:hypothetical protein